MVKAKAPSPRCWLAREKCKKFFNCSKFCWRVQIQRGVVIAIAVDSSAARNGLLTDHQITEVRKKFVKRLKKHAFYALFTC
jgi:hypothetical protein